MPKTKEQKVKEAEEALRVLSQDVEDELPLDHRFKPGEYNPRTRAKTPWTYKDLEQAYGIHEFTPDETIGVTVSGIRVQLLDNVTMTAPKCFYDIWMRSRNARRGRDTERTLRALGIDRESYGGEL